LDFLQQRTRENDWTFFFFAKLETKREKKVIQKGGKGNTQVLPLPTPDSIDKLHSRTRKNRHAKGKKKGTITNCQSTPVPVA